MKAFLYIIRQIAKASNKVLLYFTDRDLCGVAKNLEIKNQTEKEYNLFYRHINNRAKLAWNPPPPRTPKR